MLIINFKIIISDVLPNVFRRNVLNSSDGLEILLSEQLKVDFVCKLVMQVIIK
jgi:hypothetical protein